MEQMGLRASSYWLSWLLSSLCANTAMVLALSAVDDPIVDSDSFAPYVRADLPNVYYLITRHGGHVGWCEGLLPCIGRWGFQNRAVFEFVDAVLSE